MVNPLLLLRLSPWLAILLLLGVVAAQSSRIHHCHVESDGNAAKAAVLQSKLDELASQSKQQQQSVEKVVNHYITVTKPDIVKERDKILQAPLPGNCRTPVEVLQADL